MTSVQNFQLPQGLSREQQVPFCLQMITKLRDELISQRVKTTYCNANHTPIIDQFRQWKDNQVEQ